MQYDPIKKSLGSLIGNNKLLRRFFYILLDVLLLRSWHVRGLLRRESQNMPDNAEILDAGAGFGQYTYRMARMNRSWNITAIDIDESHVSMFSNFIASTGLDNRVKVTVEDLTKLAKNNTYHLIISVDVMEHIEEDKLVFRNFYKALKTGGILVISTPSDRGGSDVHNHGDKSFIDEHVRDGYNMEALTGILREVGFSDISAVYTYGFPGSLAWKLSMKYPVKLISFSRIFWVILPFYYLVVMPFALILNLLDVTTRNKSGTGLLVKAVKTQ
jgi:2-polyprenyl-3-methyl-5-hydroxy-6-metoxy-1,4-benzoquinol methylase